MGHSLQEIAYGHLMSDYVREKIYTTWFQFAIRRKKVSALQAFLSCCLNEKTDRLSDIHDIYILWKHISRNRQ